MRRAAIYSLLIFQSLWLNIVIPGHTRGVIPLPGYEKSTAAHNCCPPAQSRDSHDSKDPSDRAAHCAVCFFAVRLSLPEAIDLTPTRLGLCGEAPVQAATSIAALDAQLTYLGRAPPTA